MPERTLSAPDSPIKTVRDLMAHPVTAKRFEEFAPNFLDSQRLFKIAVMAIHNSPKLGEAEPLELLRAMLAVTQLGLEINSPRRQAFLIPFMERRGKKDERIKIEVVIGYPGYIDLSMRSGDVVDVYPEVVTEAEVQKGLFKYQLGDQPFLRHVYDSERDEDKDTPVFAYVIFTLKDGKRTFNIMPWKAVERIRNSSPGYVFAKAQGDNSTAYRKNPWVAHPFPMGAKTIIRRAMRYKRLSPELDTAIDLEDTSGRGEGFAPFIELDPSEWGSAPERIAGPQPEKKKPETKPGGAPASPGEQTKSPETEPETKPNPAKRGTKKAAAPKPTKEPEPEPKEPEPGPEDQQEESKPDPEPETQPAAQNDPDTEKAWYDPE